MRFTVLRLLTHSELGMFHAYRRNGKEGSKQRAINFDGDVVDRVFPAAKDHERIPILCRYLDDETKVVEVEQWLKKQDKNWRLEGNQPKSEFYGFVVPDVLFAMVVDSTRKPAIASWVVLPLDHPARAAILSHGESARLNKSAMIALYEKEGTRCQAILAEHYPSIFHKVEPVTSPPQTSDDSDEVNPDPLGLFKILARAGHSLPSAVADLVDNSLSHKAMEIDVTFPNPNDGGRWMCIRDDGEGMTPEGLRNAMRIGHQRDYDDDHLGKFGYGLKGAAWSQADCLTVVSRAAGNEHCICTWDKDNLAKTRRWIPLSNPVAPEHAAAVTLGESGTAVLLTKMRPPMDPIKAKGVEPYSLEVAAVRDHLELVFHKYLEGKVPGRGKVIIRINGEPLQPNNPTGHPLTKVFNEHRIELQGQGTGKQAVLTVRAYVTPNEAEFDDYHKNLSPVDRRTARNRLTLNGRANDAQGFYFYRLHRLIKWGGWEDLFQKDEHTKLLRVAVDFDRHADEQLQVDISKQLIRLPLAVTEHLKNILKVPRTDARARYDKKVKPADIPKVGPTPDVPTPTGPGAPPGGGGSGKAPTGTTPTLTPKKDKSALRLVVAGNVPWERKTGFSGEHVEITPQVPELVALVRAIDKDGEAKAALSEFLRVLETVGVPKLLSGEL
ncbi:MAG: ATP-binding protein [Pseudomonadota bacterium]|jgi:hypothetical protein